MHPRLNELRALAPLRPRAAFVRDGSRAYLCGTIGSEFDAWQRRLAAVSAADAYFAQQIGLEEVEKVMDSLEDAIRRELDPGEVLLPRRSPGYGEMPLEASREILDRLDAPRRLGVSITSSNLLVPSKSVTAVCEIAIAQ